MYKCDPNAIPPLPPLPVVTMASAYKNAREKEIVEAGLEVIRLLLEKDRDYGIDNIRETGTAGCAVRLSDKAARLRMRHIKNRDMTFNDNDWLDAAGYGILGLIESRYENGGS